MDPLKAMTSLLATQLHIVARFAVYQDYPARIWRLSQDFNKYGYILAVDDFLREAEEALDVGYSLPLRDEAMALGNDQAAKAFLTSSEVQAEIKAFIVEFSATSLDVERKHQQDKRSEKRRVSTLPRVSRNSILQRYLLLQRTEVKRRATLAGGAELRHVGYRSLAWQERPDMHPRARGQLSNVLAHSAAARKDIVHAGDKDAFEAYVVDNRERLEEKARAVRASAMANDRLLRTDPSIPVTNAQWVRWLDSHGNDFQEAMKEGAGRQRKGGLRVSGYLRMPEVARLGPRVHRSEELVAWVAKLRHQQGNLFLIAEDTGAGERCCHLVFVLTIHYEVWAFEFLRVGREE